MKDHTRRPRAYYESLYQRRLDERLTFPDLSTDSAAVEVVLRDNVPIRVRAGFDEHTVLRLVQLLGC